MNTRLLLSILFLTNFVVKAQEPIDAQIQQISPLTPNAAALGKFGNTPVSLYTGVPNIQIPIYEIRVKDFSLPISLNYHSGGVKVDDVASWVGMGWSLNAGGMISRQQRGIQDYRMVNDKNSYFHYIDTILSSTSTEVEKKNASFDLVNNRYDTESDIFSINAGSLSQKFFMDVDANIYCMPARKLQIIPESEIWFGYGYDYYGRWRVKDEKGIEYIFGKTLDNTKEEIEVTQSNSVCGASTDNPENVSSWYLNEIILPTGESITFTYEYFSFCVESAVSETFILEEINSSASTTATKYIKALRIKEIIFPSGKVEFVVGDLRRDFAGTNVLDEIKIYAHESGTYELLKSFTLDTNNPVANTTSGDESFRLALLSVTEKDKNGNLLEPYTLNYKNQTWDSYSFKLPTRGSKAQDIWGYHNGQVTNTGLIPNFLLRNGTGQIIGDVSGANRAVDTEHAKAGILEKITYPTKGSTEFFYESNVAKGATDSSDPNSVNPVLNLLNMDIRATESKMNNTWLLNSTGYDQKYGPIFQIYHEAGRSVDFDSHIMYFDDTNQCITTTPGGVGSFFECMDISLEEKNSSGIFVAVNSTVYFDRTYWLSPGEYRIKLVWDDNSQIGSYGYVDLSWTDLEDPPAPVVDDNTEMVVGGLRIAKIVDHDPVSNDDIIRNYNYDYDTADLPLIGSSGFIQNAPLHLYTKPYTFVDQGTLTVCGACTFLTSFSNSPILQTASGYVGYEKVTVTYGAIGEGGKNVSNFLSANDHIDENISASRKWPFNRTISLDWRRGLNENSAEYKYTSGSYAEVSSMNNNHTFNDNINDANYKKLIHVKVDLYPVIGGVGTTSPTIFYEGTYSIYHTISEFFFQSQTTNTQHYFSGNIDNTIDFYYDNDDHLQLTRVETTDSNGDKVIKKTRYPDDFKTASTLQDNSTIIGGALNTLQFDAVEMMKKPTSSNTNWLHRISTPIQVETYLDKNDNSIADSDELMSLQRTNFKESSGFIVPETIQTLKGEYHSTNNPLQERIVYHDYYSSGNVKEVSKTEGTHIVYIWGYNKQYPIAKIENTTYSQVSSFVSNLQTLSDNDDSVVNEDALRSAQNTMRNDSSLATAMVTTYTYDPLIGVTSITDPKGYTTYYQYDDFGRLEFVKDQDGNILSKNQYHYKN